MTLQNPSQSEIGCVARRFYLLFRAANESWLSVSREHTTFNILKFRDIVACFEGIL